MSPTTAHVFKRQSCALAMVCPHQQTLVGVFCRIWSLWTRLHARRMAVIKPRVCQCMDSCGPDSLKQTPQSAFPISDPLLFLIYLQILPHPTNEMEPVVEPVTEGKSHGVGGQWF